MPRWRQVIRNGKSEFVPIDEAARKADGVANTPAIHGPMEPFVSPLDGTVVSGRRAYRDHLKKHGVVPSSEFSPEWYEKKAKERERLYTGERTKEQVRKDRMKIHEIINQLDRAR